MWVATGSYAEPLQSDEQPESWVAFTPDLHTARLTANQMRLMNFDYRMNKLCPAATAPGFFSHQSDSALRPPITPPPLRCSHTHVLTHTRALLTDLPYAHSFSLCACLPAPLQCSTQAARGRGTATVSSVILTTSATSLRCSHRSVAPASTLSSTHCPQGMRKSLRSSLRKTWFSYAAGWRSVSASSFPSLLPSIVLSCSLALSRSDTVPFPFSSSYR